VAVALSAVAASAGPFAQDWGNFAMISSTLGIQTNRLCIGEGLRAGDIGCPSYAPSVTTAGDVSVTGNMSANKFIGDGSGLTGVTAAAGDRIVSGTTMLVAVSGTGFVSLTQGSTDTGWFDPVRGLVTLGVSATGPISGTSGYFDGNLLVRSINGRVWGVTGLGSGHTVHFQFGGDSYNEITTAYGGPSVMKSYHGMVIQNAIGTPFGEAGVSGPALIVQGVSTRNLQEWKNNSSGLLGSFAHSGRLALGNHSPLAKLDVSGTISATGAIQVGESSLGCSSGIPGAIRYSAASNTLEVCNSVGWVSLSSNSAADVQSLNDLSDTARMDTDNMFIGHEGGSAGSDDERNLGIGAGALDALNNGGAQSNVAVGHNALGNLIAGDANVSVGVEALLHATTNYNTAIGFRAGYQSVSNSGIDYMTVVGYQAGRWNSGRYAVAVGSGSGELNRGDRIVAIGHSSGLRNVGDELTAAGYESGYENAGVHAVAIGGSSGWSNTGNRMVAIGRSSGYNNAGSNTVLIGYSSGNANSGDDVVALGSGSGTGNQGDRVIALGTDAAASNDSDDVVAIGHGALKGRDATETIAIGSGAGSTGTGSYSFSGSVLLGVRAGQGLQDNANGNTLVGYQAGDNVTIGSNNIIIGYDVDAPAVARSGQLVIGNAIFGTNVSGTGTTVAEHARIGIGAAIPSSTLHVVGTISATDAVQVGVSSLDCGTGIPGAIRYNSGGIEYCDGTGPSWTSLVGDGGGSGDRITSGTLAMIGNSESSVVSLSTAGTTWGYLGNGLSFLPRLMVGDVSVSQISTTYIQMSSATVVLSCDGGLVGTMRYTSGTVQVCDGLSWSNVGIGIPTGAIMAFHESTCPDGWSEYIAARGRFLRGIDNGAGNDPGGTRAPGNVQEDAFQGHRHYNGTLTYVGGAAEGGGVESATGWPRVLRSETDGTHAGSNGTPRVAAETRGKNVAVTFCQYSGYGGGEGGGGSGASALADLSDVDVSGASNGNILTYSGGTWVASSTSSDNGIADRIISGTAVAYISPTGTVFINGRLELVTGTGVMAIGEDAARYSTGAAVVAIGRNAARDNVGSINVVAIGDWAGWDNVGANVLAVGANAAASNTVDYVTAVGTSAGWFNTGYGLVAFGDFAAYRNTGGYVTSLGSEASFDNSGHYVTAVGGRAGLGVQGGTSTAHHSVFLGYESGRVVTNAERNTFLGTQSGDNVTSGDDNILIGYQARTPAVGTSNFLNIGNVVSGTTTAGGFLTFNGGIKAAGIVTATYFEGDGSRLTGMTAAPTDRIVSGTAVAWISPTGTVFIRGRLDIASGTTVAIGPGTGLNNNAVYIGYEAGQYNGSWPGNTAVGYRAGYNTNVGELTAIGHGAGASAGQATTAVGHGAGGTGANSVLVGAGAGIQSAANRFVGVGRSAAGGNIGNLAPHDSVFVGYYSGRDVTNAEKSVFIGAMTGTSMTSGDGNILIGYGAGATLTIGHSNTIIGPGINVQSATGSGQLTIGNAIFGTQVSGTGTTVAQDARIGIKTASPQTELEVDGTISATNIRAANIITATYFEGDGRRLTGVVATAAPSDRIVSGSLDRTRIVAVSNTGYISVTQNGGETAWFDPTRGLVTLGVSATGGISGTTGYFTGPLGIGTNAPAYNLHVSGSIAHTGLLVDLSDRRLKTDIKALPASLEQLVALQPVSFRMKDDQAQQELGFIAQDVEKVFPLLVLTAADPSATKSLNYVGLIAPMVKGMQELKTANDVLRTELVAERAARLKLEAANDNLEQRMRALERRVR